MQIHAANTETVDAVVALLGSQFKEHGIPLGLDELSDAVSEVPGQGFEVKPFDGARLPEVRYARTSFATVEGECLNDCRTTQ